MKYCYLLFLIFYSTYPMSGPHVLSLTVPKSRKNKHNNITCTLDTSAHLLYISEHKQEPIYCSYTPSKRMLKIACGELTTLTDGQALQRILNPTAEDSLDDIMFTQNNTIQTKHDAGMAARLDMLGKLQFLSRMIRNHNSEKAPTLSFLATYLPLIPHRREEPQSTPDHKVVPPPYTEFDDTEV